MLTPAQLAALRQDYSQRGLRRSELDPDPIVQFNRWLAEAAEQQLIEPNAMTLATVDADGQPWSRTVLLKMCDARGFTFFTNYESDKGRQLAANPRAALTFWWGALERQVNVTGTVSEDLARRERALLPLAPRRQPARRVGLAAERSRRRSRPARTAVHQRALDKYGERRNPAAAVLGRLPAAPADHRILARPPQPPARPLPLHAPGGRRVEDRAPLAVAADVRRRLTCVSAEIEPHPPELSSRLDLLRD